MKSTRYFVDAVGGYLGGFEGHTPEQLAELLPSGAVEIDAPPADGRDLRDPATGEWLREVKPSPPEQTKADLLAEIAALRARVEALGGG